MKSISVACPFCGGTSQNVAEVCGVFIECNDCGAAGPTVKFSAIRNDDRTNAILLWQKRAGLSEATRADLVQKGRDLAIVGESLSTVFDGLAAALQELGKK